MFDVMCSNDPSHDVTRRKVGGKCKVCGGNVVAYNLIDIFIQNIKTRTINESPRPGGSKVARRIKIALCAGCGAPVWRGTEGSKGNEDEIEVEQSLKEPVYCQHCEVMRFRYPEVFHWVTVTTFWRTNQMEILKRIDSGVTTLNTGSNVPMTEGEEKVLVEEAVQSGKVQVDERRKAQLKQKLDETKENERMKVGTLNPVK